MLLKRLADYASEISSTPVLYVITPVRYILNLRGDGSLVSLVPFDTANKEQKRGALRAVPSIGRSSGIKPLLLADSSEYTLGLARENSKPQQVNDRHEAYLSLLQACWEETQEGAVKAVLDFVQNDPTSKLKLLEDYDPAALITFQVDGVFVVDLPAVQAFWARINDPDASHSKPARRMQCLVCGQEKPVLSRLQSKIKGVPNTNAAGASIISANASAFESYGLEASLIAPTCAECGEKFTKAANTLLSDKQHRITLTNLVFIFWTAGEKAEGLGGLLNEPDITSVHKLLNSLFTGKRANQLDPTAFYAVSLSGSNARVVVRDWIDTTVGAAQLNIGRWFEMQRIVGLFGDAPFSERNWPLSIYSLAAATVRDTKDLAAQTGRLLIRSALLGVPLPDSLLQCVLRRVDRNPADKKANRERVVVSREQAALIKLILLSRDDHFKNFDFTQESEYMVRLNPEHPEPAYHCGRLLCLLEDTQRAALGNVNSSLIDRFYGAASSTPAIAFPPLLRNVQNHLGKLENTSKGAYIRLQKELEEVMGAIDNKFPRTLTLEQQGLFALGYYHQRAFNRARAIEASERKKAANSNQNDADPTND